MHMCLHLYSTSSTRVNNWRWAMNYRRELQNTGNNSCVLFRLEMAWGKTVFISRSSSLQRSVASA